MSPGDKRLRKLPRPPSKGPDHPTKDDAPSATRRLALEFARLQERVTRLIVVMNGEEAIELLDELALFLVVLDRVELELRRRVTHDAKVAGLPFDPALSPEVKS